MKIFLIIVIALVAILVVVVSVQPSEFSISRSARLGAPPATVYSQVNDLRNWQAWSPWAKMDPTMKQTYEGPPAGVGASSSWVGNKQVGEGKMTITESLENELVTMKLEFFKPFAATNTAVFTFKPVDGGTEVNWIMTGRNNFMAKAAGLVMDMDKMIGGQFEQGLSSMKTISETR